MPILEAYMLKCWQVTIQPSLPLLNPGIRTAIPPHITNFASCSFSGQPPLTRYAHPSIPSSVTFNIYTISCPNASITFHPHPFKVQSLQIFFRLVSD